MKSLLEVLKDNGARIFVDSADADRISHTAGQRPPVELAGFTSNQKFLHDLALVRRPISASSRHVGRNPLWIYEQFCARVASDIKVAAGNPIEWMSCLPMHLRLCRDPAAALSACRSLKRRIPSAVVKIPFAPNEPGALLIARQLESEGIPVNLTCTFSARQCAVAALLANATWCSIFVGRTNRTTRSTRFGEGVAVSAQSSLTRFRSIDASRSRLIVAGITDREAVLETAECDALTIPCDVVESLGERAAPGSVVRLGTSDLDTIGLVPGDVVHQLGVARIAAMYRVEAELVEFLLEMKDGPLTECRSGDELFRLFDRSGFGDLFYSPSVTEWQEARRNRVPDLNGDLARKLPLDTLLSLLAFGDFQRHQEALDDALEHVDWPEAADPDSFRSSLARATDHAFVETGDSSR
ncbi:MAG TPA: transaldolase family protein [Vicinamibacterales bacterium]|nr:transaldolase family protein [Vicinamibacterales bacterium]